jgi:DeoR family suf operon transcriptional repressor
MSIQSPHSDADVLDLLRIAGPLQVSDMADALDVTPTAVRQRLSRLMAKGMIQREAVRTGRGRPHHQYWLTESGMRLTGSNFTDLATAMWGEIRAIEDEQLRRGLLRRVAQALAAGYAGQIKGQSPAERMESLRELLAQRRIPVSIENGTHRPTLTTRACPYPKLADQDASICTMERLLFSELLGQEVELTQCRLEGGGECRFQTR